MLEGLGRAGLDRLSPALTCVIRDDLTLLHNMELLLSERVIQFGRIRGTNHHKHLCDVRTAYSKKK